MRSSRSLHLPAGAAALLVALLASAAPAATFSINVLDGASEGFNDPTPVSPVGGNSGTTLGEQRLNVFEEAARIWGEYVASAVTIEINASFDPLFCNGSSAVLGSAGPETVHSDFTGAPLPNTWYVQALANSLSGTDLDGSNADLGAAFSSSIDNGCLSGISGWYYGLDHNAPAGQLDLLDTLLHEFAHGLGFLSLVDLSTGELFLGSNDIFSNFLEDHSAGKNFPAMTDAERLTAITDTGDLHWTGLEVGSVAASVLSAGRDPVSGHVEMYAPNPVEQGSSVSHFSTTLSPDELMEPFATTSPIRDLTDALLVDIGWPVCGDGLVDGDEQCDDGNRASGDGCSDSCTVEECYSCSGQPSSCSPLSEGSSCDDGNDCTGPDQCTAGVCQGSPLTGPSCDDGDPCTGGDTCTAGACAGSAPLTGCLAPDTAGKGLLKLIDKTPDRKDRLVWKWAKGTAVQSQFGDPTDGTNGPDYALCVHDAGGQLMRLDIPAGALWSAKAVGFRYKDRALRNDGVKMVRLKPGTGNAKVIVRGKGAGLSMPALGAGLTPPLRVQLTNGTTCWEGVFQNDIRVNTSEKFKAKSDN